MKALFAALFLIAVSNVAVSSVAVSSAAVSSIGAGISSFSSSTAFLAASAGAQARDFNGILTPRAPFILAENLVVGPAHFSGSADSYLIADYVGFTGYGTDVLSVRGSGNTEYGVGLATGTTAIGFRFGAFTGEIIDIVLQNGSVLTQPAPVDALFLGLVSDTPISGVVFRSAGILNLDIIGFTTGSANIPEPAPLAVLVCAMAGLCLTRHRPAAK